MSEPVIDFEVVTVLGVLVERFETAERARDFIAAREAKGVPGLALDQVTHIAPIRRRLPGPAAHLRSVA